MSISLLSRSVALYLLVMVGWFMLSQEYSKFAHAVFALRSWGDNHHGFWLMYSWALSFSLCFVPLIKRAWILVVIGVLVPFLVVVIKLVWIVISPGLVDNNPDYYSSYAASSLLAIYLGTLIFVILMFRSVGSIEERA